MQSLRDDEGKLIARSQCGDLEAFNELVLRYQGSTYNLALRMLGDADTAADLTQEAFIAAFRNLQTFRGGTSFRAWLLRITTNLVYDHWRRRRHYVTESLDRLNDEEESATASIVETLTTAQPEGNPEAALLARELQELIQQGLAQLPPEQRLAVVLCDIEGLSYEEIAAVMGVALGTVRSRIARGRGHLRAFLVAHQELLPRQFRLS
jgi:RNA polymerase sigma-70 factor (ECF subfamily)